MPYCDKCRSSTGCQCERIVENPYYKPPITIKELSSVLMHIWKTYQNTLNRESTSLEMAEELIKKFKIKRR